MGVEEFAKKNLDFISKNGLVTIISGSQSDNEHIGKIQKALSELQMPCYSIVCSAHKNTQELLDFLKTAEQIESPMVYITVAGRSNALSGVVACNTKRPVIACPPFRDMATYQVDIHSSLRMPTKTPVGVVVEPENAALYAKRILDLEKYQDIKTKKVRGGA